MGTPPPNELTGGRYSYPKTKTSLTDRGVTVGSIDAGYFDDELTASIKAQPRNSSVTYDTSVKSSRYTTPSAQSEIDALQSELRMTAQKKEEYLGIIVNQADAIKELRAQLKAKDDHILELQNRLAPNPSF